MLKFVNHDAAKTCVLYARLSVSREESVSIRRQLGSCRSYAQARGWRVLGEFVDEGVSASTTRPEQRKGWADLLSTGGFDAVVIWKVDRLARRVIDFLNANESLQCLGAGLVAVADPIDMTSPQGRAFAVMLAVFGEMESESMRARVRAARAHLAEQGRWPGGTAPYGYLAEPAEVGAGKRLGVDPVRIGWLRTIVRMAVDGISVSHIANFLTESGAPLPSGGSKLRKAGNTTWNRQTVAALLRNPILAGMTPRNPGRSRTDKNVSPFNVLSDEDGNPIVNHNLAIITVEEFMRLNKAP